MANQKFTLTFDAQLNISQMKGSLDQIKNSLSSLKLPANLEKGLQGTFQKLAQEVQNYEKIVSQGISSDKDMKNLSASAEKILQLYNKLGNEFKSLKNAPTDALRKMFPPEVAKNIESATKALDTYKSTINNLNSNINNKKGELEKYQASLEAIKRTQAELQSQSVDKVNGLDVNEDNLNKLKVAWEELSKAPQAYLEKAKAATEADLTKGQKSYFTKLKNDIDAAKRAYEQMQAAMDTKKGLANAEKDINKYEESIRKIKNELAGLEQVLPKQQSDALKQLFEDLSKIDNLDLSKFSNNAKGAEEAVASLINQALTNLKNNLNDVEGNLERSGTAFDKNAEAVRRAVVVYSDFERRLQDVQALKNRIQYFFGLQNAINLFKRAVRGAFETVKELDAAMTETAVVTDNTISDMWAKLPEYTKRANELGVSTLAAYKSATLYYQQGLNDEQAAALSTETLKMARIAGLEAAEATDRMTNALRGFNMELNEVSAQKVDDVYSQLAAMSASNVDEISTAMTKVASLAHSANMEFETTAAFLAQIIETTRESAETAGTALKTVVARFSEVKKLYSMDELRGTDEEGQGIDVNKISTALRTAGIDLNKYFVGEVGLDDIFMELASKWDSLTSVQQRYIATQAAGSRQQSRFIALMQDYARTQELVGAAYDANGASAKQFEKTQDSLQSKLARLKNAWNEFLMGLANNVVIKGAVDALTTLLNIVNKLTGALGDGAGGILKFVTAIAAMRGIGGLFSNSGLITRGLAQFGTTNLGRILLPGAGAVAKEMAAAGGKKGLFAGLFGGRAAAATAGDAAWAASGWANFFGEGAAGTAAGTAASGGLAAAAIPAGIITAVVAAVVGTVAIQDYIKSGKKQVKDAEKAVEAQQKAADKQKEIADLQKESYNKYLENEKIFNTSSDAVEKANARAEMAKALATLAGIDKTNVTTVNGQSVLDKTAAQTVTERLEQEQAVTEASGHFAQAMLQSAEAAKAEKSILESRVQDGMESWYTKGGSWWENFKWNSAHLGMSSDERRYAAEQWNAEQQAKAESYRAAAVPEMAAAAEGLLKGKYSEDIVESISSAYGKLINPADLQKQIQDKSGVGRFGGRDNIFNKADLKQKYESIYGVGSAKDLSVNELSTALAQKDVSEAQKEMLENLAKAVEEDTSLQQLFEALEGKIDIDETTDEFKDALDKLATITHKDTDDIKKDLAKAKAARAKQKEVNATNIFDKALKSNIPINETLANQIKNLSPELTQQVSDIIDQAFGSISDEGFGKLLSSLIDDSMNTEQIKQIQDFYNNFNLDNPIQAFHKLKEAKIDAENSGNEVFKEVLKNIEVTNKEIFNTGNLFQSFLTSTSYDEITNSLEDFIKANGRVTSENIEELADSCKELQYLLEDTTVTAQGLAEAFTQFEEGKLAIDDITSSLLEAFSAGESFNSLIDNVTKWIKDFNTGTDLTEGTQHIVDVAEDALKYVESWQFGNTPLKNIYDHLFGEDAYDDYMKDNWGRPLDQLESEIGGRISEISKWAENEGLGALQFLSGKNVGITDKGNNLFEWDLDRYKDAAHPVQAAIEDIAKALGVTDDAARAFIEGWASHMYDLGTEWDNLNFKEKMEAFNNDLSNGKVVTEQELEALAADTGKTVDEIIAEINRLREKAGEEIVVRVSWKDENGQSKHGEDLFKSFDETLIQNGAYREVINEPQQAPRIPKAGDVFGQENAAQTTNTMPLARNITKEVDYSKFLDENKFIQSFKDAAGESFDAIDYSKLHQNLVEAYKMPPEQADEVANHIAEATQQEMAQTIMVPKLNADGIIEQVPEAISATTAEGLQAGIEAAQEAAKYELIAQKLATTDFTGLSETLTSTITSAGEAGGAAAADKIQQEIGSRTYSIIVNATVLGLPEGSSTGRIPVTGGIVGSYAKGSENFHINPGTSLIGEEGPEIVWNKDGKYSYVAGQNGPEFTDLQPGDRIFNAAETRRIIRNSHAAGGYIDSFASGGWKTGDTSSKKSGSGSGSGSGKGEKEKTPEEWKNELDWLYNLMEDIVELERDQKAIEEQYQDALQDQSKTGRDLYNLLVKQLGNLYTQLDHQTFALQKREQEMREFMDITNDKDQYLWYNWQDRTLEIDWDAIDRITDEEEYKHVKELVDEAEEIQDKMDDADDAIMDITNQIQELENIWRDTFTDFEKRVLDAVVKMYQTVIDNYSELNDTLNNSNQSILDSLQKEINLQRQIRDNTKTEEEISDDEARLAYLRRDTSGGNELAALQLQKELADKRESYEDSLVDQAISRLQDDNAAAQEQRERQIEIMQAQLDYQSENGEFNAYISELLTSAMGADGELLTNSDLVDLLKEQENWAAMSDVSKEVWDEELNGTFKEVAAFLLKQNAEENGTFYTALTKAVEGVSSAIGSYSQAMVKIGNQISSAASGGYGGGSSGGSSGGGPSGPDKTPQSTIVIKGTANIETGKSTYTNGWTPSKGGYWRSYDTGGIASYTGPAWLDGTPNEPEYVLNARQTDAFLRLADVLPQMMGSGGGMTTTSFGSNYFNVSVNVDQISSDYDVDRMVDRIKDKLYDDASYRNVNTLSFLR